MAEAGKLVGLLAGAPADTARVARLLEPVCHNVIDCGSVPAALNTKLAVNILLITMVTGLTEAWSFAERSGIDLETFRRAVDSGPMAITVSRTKTGMLLAGDFPAPAALTDVLYNVGNSTNCGNRAVRPGAASLLGVRNPRLGSQRCRPGHAGAGPVAPGDGCGAEFAVSARSFGAVGEVGQAAGGQPVGRVAGRTVRWLQGGLCVMRVWSGDNAAHYGTE